MVVTTGTAKARHIGAALRAARESKEPKLSVRALARQLEIDHSLLSMWETGKRAPRPDQVASVLTALEINGVAKQELVDLAREPDGPQWLGAGIPARAHQMAALLEFERTATVITDVAPLLIPGLLQTGDYTRSIMRAGRVPGEEVEQRVVMRIGRRDAFQRSANPAQFNAFVGESALRQIVGSPAVMAGQLTHLRSVCAQPNVDLRVIPTRCDWNPSLSGPFMLLQFAMATPIVHLEHSRSGLFLHEPEDVDAYKQAVEGVRAVSMSPEETAGFIEDLITEVEET